MLLWLWDTNIRIRIRNRNRTRPVILVIPPSGDKVLNCVRQRMTEDNGDLGEFPFYVSERCRQSQRHGGTISPYYSISHFIFNQLSVTIH